MNDETPPRKDWIKWDRSDPMPEGVLFPVVLLDLSLDFSTPNRFYRDGVIAYWPDPITTYAAK